ncbi:MAG: DNA mismatch repair protein MutS, partial [Lachnospiraceae bacterium]|nr:DNA mismatch repair protein MutS [Lachnospiraceae bacterium]
MMQNYMATKKEHKDCILLYRLGDFYEVFFDDALTVSKELGLTLTGKACGLEERAPMCGVPYHAVESYINKLIEGGHKVAICEQMEDPKEAKGLVRREVTRIVTPGTNLDISALDETRNNYLMCIVYMAGAFGISVSDITTGEFMATEAPDQTALIDEIFRFEPAEIICNEAFLVSGVNTEELKYRLSVTVYSLDAWYFDDSISENTLMAHFKVKDLSGFGLTKGGLPTIAAGALLKYLQELHKGADISHLKTLTTVSQNTYMLLDAATRRNLELTETMREKQKKGSLFGVLDRTKTAMGARTLRGFIEQPLLKKADIEKRLNAVSDLYENHVLREELREYLRPIYDLERLMSRISYHTANPRDLIAFAGSVDMLPHIKALSEDVSSRELKALLKDLDPLTDLCRLIHDAIEEDPPLQIKEGGIIRSSFHEKVDELRRAKTEGKKWLAALEEEDRERTGIRNLRIKYNKVFGYYFEVTNSFKDQVPADYIRKQTLTNAERYTTDRLKELEDIILNAEDKLFSLEYDIFNEIRQTLSDAVERVQKSAKIIAELDAYASLADVAVKNRYCRPKLNERGVIDIRKGRHPVVETMIENDLFVENDTYLDNKDRISVITGPNMAGKSTYMRQTALIVLMAQM